MSNFAEVNESNQVLRVLVIPDEENKRGHTYLSKDLGLGGKWIKADNYASNGGFYNEELKRFEPKQPFASWSWNEEAFTWDPPTPRPTVWVDWNEEALTWDPVIQIATAGI
jgi:hypothetical protein